MRESLRGEEKERLGENEKRSRREKERMSGEEK